MHSCDPCPVNLLRRSKTDSGPVAWCAQLGAFQFLGRRLDFQDKVLQRVHSLSEKTKIHV